MTTYPTIPPLFYMPVAHVSQQGYRKSHPAKTASARNIAMECPISIKRSSKHRPIATGLLPAEAASGLASNNPMRTHMHPIETQPSKTPRSKGSRTGPLSAPNVSTQRLPTVVPFPLYATAVSRIERRKNPTPKTRPTKKVVSHHAYTYQDSCEHVKNTRAPIRSPAEPTRQVGFPERRLKAATRCGSSETRGKKSGRKENEKQDLRGYHEIDLSILVRWLQDVLIFFPCSNGMDDLEIHEHKLMSSPAGEPKQVS